MNRILLALIASAALADAPKPPSTEDAQVAHVADAKWTPPKAPEIPPGAVASPIAVDPANGGSIAYAKFPGGYKFPAHWHSAAEYTTLIAGKLHFTLDGRPHTLVPGSYIVIPPKTVHSAVCAEGAECVLLTRRGGPTDYNFVK